MTKVLVIEHHADAYAAALRAEFPDLPVLEARHLSEAPDDLSGIEVLIAFGVAVNDDLMRGLRDLKWIQSLATGVDHFLRFPGLRPDTIITSGRGIHGRPVRETVVYLMMGVSRNVTRQVEKNKAHEWDRRPWSLLAGQTAAVVGIGVIGEAVATLLKAFGMTVIGVTRTPRSLADFDEMIPTARLAEAAAKADYVINILPATPENNELFDREVFAAMKRSGYFINVGRGQTVNEADLLVALRSGQIAGAGLDVYDTFPLPPDSPLWDAPNVFLTPHVGGHVHGYEKLLMPIVIENMRLFLAGRMADMRNVVEH
jgi:D-2-hydroxyacid dehydrogenase (NADP+)